jgi:hypothetical protein
MGQDPFPGRGHDGEESAGAVPLPADDGNGPAESDGDEPLDEPEQGLFVCLPAEELTLAGFAEDGRTDTMGPGPLLATVVHAVAGDDGQGLAALSDDQLTGVISAVQRLEARVAWTRLAALAEFAARRPASADKGVRGTGAPAPGPDGISVFAADELTGELRMTWQSVAEQLAYARAVTQRLPRTLAALAAGLIHPVHVRIIEDETRMLTPEDAAAADEELAEAAAGKTFGQLRYFAHRLVLKLDPGAAARRKERAGRDAHVRPFREDSGNAGMIARELPSDELLASWQHVQQRALDLRAAGVPGTLRELRVRAYLDLLQERDSRQAPVGGADGTAGGPDDGPGRPPGGPGGDGRPGPRPGPPGDGPSLAALVNITVPLAALQGDPGAAGEAGGFGLLDAQDARALVTAAARHPRTQWCLTVLHPDGTAAAHGCARGPRALSLTLKPVIRGPCQHAQAERGYRPSRALRHLVNARNTRCTAPGCGQPAARCDLDHTTPWHQGGRTCPCNLAPLCRHHHRCKQAEDWWLEQPEPGVLRWRVPSGRTYTTTPTVYST